MQGQIIQSAKDKISLFRDTTNTLQNSLNDSKDKFVDMTEVVHVIKNDLKDSCSKSELTQNITDCQEIMRNLTHTAYHNYEQLNSLTNVLGGSTRSMRTVINVRMSTETNVIEKLLMDKVMQMITDADDLKQLQDGLVNVAWAMERLEESFGPIAIFGNDDESLNTDSSSLLVDCTALMLATGMEYFPQEEQSFRRNLRSLKEDKIKQEKGEEKGKDKNDDGGIRGKDKDKDAGVIQKIIMKNGIEFNIDDAKEIMMETGFACLSNNAEPIISALYPAFAYADKFLLNDESV